MNRNFDRNKLSKGKPRQYKRQQSKQQQQKDLPPSKTQAGSTPDTKKQYKRQQEDLTGYDLPHRGDGTSSFEAGEYPQEESLFDPQEYDPRKSSPDQDYSVISTESIYADPDKGGGTGGSLDKNSNLSDEQHSKNSTSSNQGGSSPPLSPPPPPPVKPVEGIMIIDPNNDQRDSCELIHGGTSKTVLDLIKIQLELKDQTPRVLNNLGCIYALLGNYPKARQCFLAAIEYPNNADVTTKQAAQENMDILKSL